MFLIMPVTGLSHLNGRECAVSQTRFTGAWFPEDKDPSMPLSRPHGGHSHPHTHNLGFCHATGLYWEYLGFDLCPAATSILRIFPWKYKEWQEDLFKALLSTSLRLSAVPPRYVSTNLWALTRELPILVGKNTQPRNYPPKFCTT